MRRNTSPEPPIRTAVASIESEPGDWVKSRAFEVLQPTRNPVPVGESYVSREVLCERGNPAQVGDKGLSGVPPMWDLAVWFRSLPGERNGKSAAQCTVRWGGDARYSVRSMSVLRERATVKLCETEVVPRSCPFCATIPSSEFIEIPGVFLFSRER